MTVVLMAAAAWFGQYPVDYAYRGVFDDPSDSSACRTVHPVSVYCPSNLGVFVDGSFAAEINCGANSDADLADPPSASLLHVGFNASRVALEVKDLQLTADPIRITDPQSHELVLPSGSIPIPGGGNAPYILSCKLSVRQYSHSTLLPSVPGLTFNWFVHQFIAISYEGIIQLDEVKYPVGFIFFSAFPIDSPDPGVIDDANGPAWLDVHLPYGRTDSSTGFFETIQHGGHTFQLRVSSLRLESCGGTFRMTPTVRGDFNGDGVIDPNDLEPFTFCRAGSEVSYRTGCERADLDADGDVDMDDFGALQRCFGLAACP